MVEEKVSYQKKGVYHKVRVNNISCLVGTENKNNCQSLELEVGGWILPASEDTYLFAIRRLKTTLMRRLKPKVMNVFGKNYNTSMDPIIIVDNTAYAFDEEFTTKKALRVLKSSWMTITVHFWLNESVKYDSIIEDKLCKVAEEVIDVLNDSIYLSFSSEKSKPRKVS